MTPQRRKALAYERTKFEEHIGHTVFMNYGEARVSGRLVRLSVSEEYGNIVWIKQGTDNFCTAYYTDQVRECSCGEGKKK
jgi:hypothetical protein